MYGSAAGTQDAVASALEPFVSDIKRAGTLQAQREAEKGKQATGFGSEQVLKKSQNVFKVKLLPCSSYKCYRRCSISITD